MFVTVWDRSGNSGVTFGSRLDGWDVRVGAASSKPSGREVVSGGVFGRAGRRNPSGWRHVARLRFRCKGPGGPSGKQRTMEGVRVCRKARCKDRV